MGQTKSLHYIPPRLASHGCAVCPLHDRPLRGASSCVRRSMVARASLSWACRAWFSARSIAFDSRSRSLCCGSAAAPPRDGGVAPASAAPAPGPPGGVTAPPEARKRASWSWSCGKGGQAGGE